MFNLLKTHVYYAVQVSEKNLFPDTISELASHSQVKQVFGELKGVRRWQKARGH
ncbi:MAG: hypothetical protein ACSLE5_07445 [Porticoccaceae bacterium]